MRLINYILMTLSMTAAIIALAPCVNAQTPLPEGTFVSETALFEREYPRVDTANRVWFRLYAPKAQDVKVNCCGFTNMEREKKQAGGMDILNPLLRDSISIIL